MKKRTITIIILILLILIFIYKNVLIFKNHDLTIETNKINNDLPYLKYNFEKVSIFKGLSNNYILWEVKGNIVNKETKKSFLISGAFNLDKKYNLDYKSFDNDVDLFGYKFILFSKPKLKDGKRMVYQSKDSIYLSLEDIPTFLDSYLTDNKYPLGRKYDNLIENLDYIPHIIYK